MMLLDDYLRKWLKEPDEYEWPKVYGAKNENGEIVIVTITKGYFKTETAQSNNVIRENYWYRDGSSTESYTR